MLCAAIPFRCPSRAPSPQPSTPTRTATSTSTSPPAPDFPHVDEIAVPNDLPAYVLRGPISGHHAAVFLPGMCVHPQGYMQAFAFAASRYGHFVGLQGDVLCGGPYRRWSSDLDAMDRRIRAAFVAAGLGEPAEITVIGYSQGAERAEHLHARWPARYPKLVLMAGPVEPRADRLKGARAVALMAGTLELQTLMQAGARELPRHGVAAAYFPMPDAPHGQLGTEPEVTMSKVLEWLDQAGN